ncbi:MAG: flavin reductase family protein [Rhodothermales bacterium]
MSTLISGEDLRAVMRHVPSPVTIVTFPGARGAKGITIGSFTSVSLDPPLISFNVMLGSSMHDELLHAENYAIQILREDQVALGERFSRPDQSSKEQFEGVSHQIDHDEMPMLDNVLAILRCRPFNVVPAGDHSLFIGEVLKANSLSSGKPLLYYQQSYRRVGEEA